MLVVHNWIFTLRIQNNHCKHLNYESVWRNISTTIASCIKDIFKQKDANDKSLSANIFPHIKRAFIACLRCHTSVMLWNSQRRINNTKSHATITCNTAHHREKILSRPRQRSVSSKKCYKVNWTRLHGNPSKYSPSSFFHRI